MINRNLIAREVRRLFGLPFPPATEEAKLAMVDEYTAVLRESVESKEHCTAVIDWLMRHSQRCPTPGDVLAAAEAVKAPDKAKAPLGCEKCAGSGYIQFTRLVQASPGMMRCEYSFAKPCDCALGQFIQPEYEKRKNVTPGRAQDLG